jgi:hypothetical protein
MTFPLVRKCAWCGEAPVKGNAKTCSTDCAMERTKAPTAYSLEEFTVYAHHLIKVTAKGKDISYAITVLGKPNKNGKIVQ